MNPIGLIAAMPEECRPLLQGLPAAQAFRLGSCRAWRFRLGGQDCLLVQSGMGLQRAGQAARALLAEARPSLLVSFGIAGALLDGLQIGDVLALGGVALLEQGQPGPFLPLAALSAPAWQAAAAALQPHAARLLAGVALTTHGAQVVRLPPLGLENPLIEMETAAIARAAADAGVPLLGLRAVSDSPAQPLPVDPAAVLDEAGRLRPGPLARLLFRRPTLLFQLARLRRSTALAAGHAALAVLAALGSRPITG